jgi:hypothetical protein
MQRSLVCVPSGVEKGRGLVFPDTDAEIVLHRETTFPSSVEAYYSVDDVIVAVAHYVAQGCQNTGGPFRHHNWEMRGNQRSIWYETLYP